MGQAKVTNQRSTSSCTTEAQPENLQVIEPASTEPPELVPEYGRKQNETVVSPQPSDDSASKSESHMLQQEKGHIFIILKSGTYFKILCYVERCYKRDQTFLLQTDYFVLIVLEGIEMKCSQVWSSVNGMNVLQKETFCVHRYCKFTPDCTI